mgnify:FL=1
MGETVQREAIDRLNGANAIHSNEDKITDGLKSTAWDSVMKLGSLGTKFSVLLALIWLLGGSATIFT